uniref:PH domain-containing protein n=1 Tax=Anopheles melas TaxID=34690 RepID=A0A182UB54_9DIPT
MRSHVPSYQGTLDSGAAGGAGGAYGEEGESLYLQRAGYQQHPGVANSPPGGAASEIIIQQNIPGQVVNQACQTQISSMVLAGSSNAAGQQQQQQQQQQQMKSSPSDTLSSPSHDSSERKRSAGGQQHTLKSPVTRRPANAPVTLAGWLYKQGSDGLKVWRRRWFVLSEYVLYYYKGQEEEKLLGTVLLPSYKVSACFPEDKIYRKFAFKCEHANMRTFVFAAESGESMSQWSHGSNDTMKLIQQASGNGSSSSSAGGGGGGVSALNDSMSLPQPLYANAPPKPRRVNDGGYSSPSPEHTMLHDRNDRRTPDTYGPPNSAIDPKHMSDYEDIYNLTMLSKSLPASAMEAAAGGGSVAAGGTTYKRPSSPLRYEGNGAFPAYMGAAMYNAGQFEHQSPGAAGQHPQHAQMRARPIPPSIPRPHSADFLDYEARHPMNQAAGGVTDEPSPVHRTPRPKSSLDINRTPDHYYYSEASYAEKMRLQSASYLQRTNNPGAGASRKQRSDDMQGLFASGTMPRDGLYRSGSGKIMQLQASGQQGEDYPHGGSQSMPRPSATDHRTGGTGQGRPTVSSLKKQGTAQQQQEQFARSASARLPRKEEDSSLRDGERKREESMKRLLEWKQRMLQSPLTKKIASQHAATMASAESLNRGSNASVGGADRRNEDIYGLKADAEALLRGDYYASSYERQSVGDLTALGSVTAARKHGGSAVNIAQASSSAFGSQMKLNGDYNSYSSDDEGKV